MKSKSFLDGQIILINGDCRDELIRPDFSFDVVLTDPVWSNKCCEFQDYDYISIFELFSMRLSENLCTSSIYGKTPIKRAVFQLGYASNPSFLSKLPYQLRFNRVCVCKYNFPLHRGRTLGGIEIAYCYGDFIQCAKGRRCVPGMFSCPSGTLKGIRHPCPRPLPWTRWLCNWWSDEGETILDPFMGSGTTALAAIACGNRKFVGIEINESYYEEACERVAKYLEQMTIF